MMAHDRLGFVLKSSTIAGNVFIPRYYNPEIFEHLGTLEATHDLILLGDLIRKRFVRVSTGDEIGKMAYGTGVIPFIRTSDISNWELKADPKQGVSEEIYEKYASKQDVKPGDLLFVRDGTYLIGNCCMVTEGDSKILFQSHIFKFRVAKESPISAPLLLALLSAPSVRKQIRAKQFTADIIDTIGNRHLELLLPSPRNVAERLAIEHEALAVVKQRLAMRELLKKIPLWAQGVISDLQDNVPKQSYDYIEPAGNPGFAIKQSQLISNIFVPRYYDTTIAQELKRLSETHDLVSIRELVKNGVLFSDTGIEVGKMAYGTGPVPFIRTSDISNWELKAEPKQSVNEELFDEFKDAQDVRAGDIFIVRDGTYLVGTSCIITEHDTRLLYCGGIYKIRVRKPEVLDPYLFLAVLNCPIVRRQMRAKQFTRDVIDTLGKRIFEIILPFPKEAETRIRIASATREAVNTRVELRQKAQALALRVEGAETVNDEEVLL